MSCFLFDQSFFYNYTCRKLITTAAHMNSKKVVYNVCVCDGVLVTRKVTVKSIYKSKIKKKDGSVWCAGCCFGRLPQSLGV